MIRERKAERVLSFPPHLSTRADLSTVRLPTSIRNRLSLEGDSLAAREPGVYSSHTAGLCIFCARAQKKKKKTKNKLTYMMYECELHVLAALQLKLTAIKGAQETHIIYDQASMGTNEDIYTHLLICIHVIL